MQTNLNIELHLAEKVKISENGRYCTIWFIVQYLLFYDILPLSAKYHIHVKNMILFHIRFTLSTELNYDRQLFLIFFTIK